MCIRDRRETGRAVERQITEQVEGSAEVASVVTKLEKQYDEHSEGISRRSLLAGDNDELPDADELGAAVEAYLASRDSAAPKESPEESTGEPGKGRRD